MMSPEATTMLVVGGLVALTFLSIILYSELFDKRRKGEVK